MSMLLKTCQQVCRNIFLPTCYLSVLRARMQLYCWRVQGVLGAAMDSLTIADTRGIIDISLHHRDYDVTVTHPFQNSEYMCIRRGFYRCEIV
ncbi:hypothetical protein MtrunA17_Chr1g0182891 [Medicago truncatula]|uniref:Uncharacterized protein n=1 Tax=Medicago truncatula TaxID=3880 RepID=A0A072VLZ9_MEDTR|nr:hypothetical protein MTR_1g069205 [Medicago truncatula]RHN79947.1 hypothetical protein MtrunA17_Chr1g0182891 [Medicago truncatula]